MKRTHNSFLQGLITQYEYNHNNVKLDEELENFSKIPRPFKFSNLKVHKMIDIKNKISLIRKNIVEISKKVGYNCIFDALLICVNLPIKKILSQYSDKDKNLIYFYNNVFMHLTLDIYNKELTDQNNGSIIPYNNKNQSKNTFDLKNIGNYSYPTCFKMYKKEIISRKITRR